MRKVSGLETIKQNRNMVTMQQQQQQQSSDECSRRAREAWERNRQAGIGIAGASPEQRRMWGRMAQTSVTDRCYHHT